MTFLAERFPLEISYGSKGGPKFSTTVLMLASGHEKRNSNWSVVRAEYEVQHGIKDRDQMEDLLKFFYVAQGKAHTFRFKDWMDFTLISQDIGDGVGGSEGPHVDGSVSTFQVIKQYQVGSFAYNRIITKLVEDTLEIEVDGNAKTEDTDYTVNYDTGIITFLVGKVPSDGQTVTVLNGEFDVHVRFDTDHFDITHDFWETMSWPSIPIVEVRRA